MKLDKIQKQVISGRVGNQGRTTMKSNLSFDRYQHSNREIESSFYKSRIFPQYKLVQPSYVIFSLENQRSLCHKIIEMIERPPLITSDIDEEFYWVNYTVPIIKKSIVK